MYRLELQGLRPDLPIGAMAAFGVLRICAALTNFPRPTLSWKHSGGAYHAVLTTEVEIAQETLARTLVDEARAGTTNPELTWAPALKSATLEDFREHAREAIQATTPRDRASADWFASFGTDLVQDDGYVKPTPFDMTVARQRFIADMRKLAESFDTLDTFNEALFGPWRYHDDQHSFGWDPSTIKMGAFTYKPPTAMSNTGVRAAVWLAFESLPLFPCFYDHGLATCAFRRADTGETFSWPVWDGALSIESLRTLLAWPGLLSDDFDVHELRGRGLLAIYRTTRFKPNKYLASFSAPEMVYASGS